MNKIGLKLLLMAFLLSVAHSGIAESAQTINGKSLAKVDDIVKEVSKGDLSLQKKGLITLRAGSNIGDVDIFATVFSEDASASTKRLYHNSDATKLLGYYAVMPHYLRPAVSRRLYNGKRALMTHNLAPNGQLTYYFRTLSNNRNEDSAEKRQTTQALIDSVQMSEFGEYTTQEFENSSNFFPQVHGIGVLSVKGYDREIFVAASGPNNPGQPFKTMRLEFFAISADAEGNMSQEPLTELTHNIGFNAPGYTAPGFDYPQPLKIVSLAVGDFDGDRYNNEIALMINTVNDILIFVYKLNFSGGRLSLMSLGDAKGINVYSTKLWGDDLETQPVTDMAVGDFDGDGIDEIALLFKTPKRAKSLKNSKGWPDGPMTGEIHCRIHKWNAEKRAFNTEETIKEYNKEKYIDSMIDAKPEAQVAGVIGLRAVAADLDGDGKDEIVTLLLGYYHHKQWDGGIKAYKLRRDDFYAYPHLAVWTFNRGSIKPVHDDAHIKGGGNASGYDYNWLRDHAQGDKKKGLLIDEPYLSYKRIWYNKWWWNRNNSTSGTNPDDMKYVYILNAFSIAAGPFTGTLGQVKTIDDIVVTWNRNWKDNVTVFKTKLNANKQFDGFEDGKLVMREDQNGTTYRGFIAADFAGEGVELDKPTHLRKLSNRSYIAALNAIPYHVDNVSVDGKALTEQPVNFTYSEPDTGGNMTVSYGKSTTDTTTSTVKQDLSQSVETMFALDPEAKHGGVFAGVKGLVGFASAVGDIVTGIKVGTMSTEEKNAAVWKPTNPVAFLNKVIDFVTDKVTTIDQRTNSTSSKTTIEKNITATTHDAILYTESARHIWRYPVMTRPLPMWLAWGPRIDSTQIDDPSTVNGDKELYITFTMSENSQLRTSSSQTDSVYQPLHEEGNFFSYPSQIGDVEGYNESGLLAEENTWEFSNTLDQTGITFTKATSNMRHTEKKVTPSTFTSVVSGLDKLVRGKDGNGLNMPDSDNPKTFSKEFNKTEKISYTLQGSSTLTAMRAADHTIRMQPFVAKEGAMTLAAAVQLTSSNYARLWDSSSIYQKKPDPALLLPFKFVKDGSKFRANNNDKSATKIRGIRFYMPDFAFFTDNRLVKGQNYEIRVPLYNASFKDTGNFNVRLSWTTENSPTSVKTPIATVPMTLSGWSNNGNKNKGTAVFEWTPNLTSSKKASNNEYYLYVEIDPENAVDEVHEERYLKDKLTIGDYGGNNTGFYPFYVYDPDDDESSGGTVISSAAVDNEIQLTQLQFTDGSGQTISDMAAFIKEHSDQSFVTITTNFNYNGPEVPYAFFMGCLLTQSGRQKMPSASLNTIVDLSKLDDSDISDVFMVHDIALFKGQNQVTFTTLPSELLVSANEIAAAADLATFGVIALTEEEIQALEEFYEGEDPAFESETIPDNIVSSATSKTYTLTSSEDVFWLISDVKFNGTVATSETESDDRGYLDITLEAKNLSDDAVAPSDYGHTVTITVNSIAGYTPKGDYEITVQKSDYGDEWTDAEVLRFNAENADDEGSSNGVASASGGCNAGLGVGALAFLLSGGFMAFRRKS